MHDILGRARSDALKAPVQVYRSLEKLERRGIVHRIEALNAFVACSEHDERCKKSEHRHDEHRPGFVICRDCGAVREFEDGRVGKIAREAADADFEVSLSRARSLWPVRFVPELGYVLMTRADILSGQLSFAALDWPARLACASLPIALACRLSRYRLSGAAMAIYSHDLTLGYDGYPAVHSDEDDTTKPRTTTGRVRGERSRGTRGARRAQRWRR